MQHLKVLAFQLIWKFDKLRLPQKIAIKWKLNVHFFKKPFFSLLLFILLVACGSESVKELGEKESLGLKGLWKSNCFDAYSGASRTYYHIETYNFSDDTYTLEFDQYLDDECSELVPEGNAEKNLESGSYAIGEKLVSEDGTEVNEITFTRTYIGVDGEFRIIEMYLYAIIDDIFYKNRFFSDEVINYDTPYTRQNKDTID